MHSGQTVSLGFVIFKVLRNPIASQLTYNEAAEYSLEFIKLIGAPLAFGIKNERVKIIDYKGRLPKDIVNIRGVRFLCDTCEANNNSVAMSYATDIYHKTYDNDGEPNTQYYNNADCTYTVEKNIITTSEENGYVQISYETVLQDKDGFPLIPDQEEVKMGLEYYILFRHLEPIWLAGKISDKAFNYIVQKKSWYIGSSNTSLQMPNVDRLEAIMNSINRIIPNHSAFKNFYKKSGRREQFRKYN